MLTNIDSQSQAGQNILPENLAPAPTTLESSSYQHITTSPTKVRYSFIFSRPHTHTHTLTDIPRLLHP